MVAARLIRRGFYLMFFLFLFFVFLIGQLGTGVQYSDITGHGIVPNDQPIRTVREIAAQPINAAADNVVVAAATHTEQFRAIYQQPVNNNQQPINNNQQPINNNQQQHNLIEIFKQKVDQNKAQLKQSKDPLAVVQQLRPVLPVDNRPDGSQYRSNNAILDKVDVDPGLYLPKDANGTYPLLLNGKLVASSRIFHLDLKGAAPKLAYYQQLFPFVKRIGATGLLIEWEDTFPYEGILQSVRGGHAYSKDDIRQILRWAVENQLDIIPLVQTFGHLEWILKFEEFAKYRQVQEYPQVICLADDDAVNLVKTALDQVLEIHLEFPMPFFHIGADEAFQVGMCEKDRQLLAKELSNNRDSLMLRHISTIAKHILSKPKLNATRLLMWHDMLTHVNNDLLKKYEIGELLEPVVWNYAEQLYLQNEWNRFANVFPYMWGASAFKGADGPDRFYSNVQHYWTNNRAWIDQMTIGYTRFKQFRGIIITGWQRFDHFAILCETIPVGLISAAVNFIAIRRAIATVDQSVLTEATQALQCDRLINIQGTVVAANNCNFPGFGVYANVQALPQLFQQIKASIYDDYQVRGWMAPFNMRHNYSQTWYINRVINTVNSYASMLQSRTDAIRREMSQIFFADTVDEFILEYVEPELKRLIDMRDSLQGIRQMRAFPLRPFAILNEVKPAPLIDQQQQQSTQRRMLNPHQVIGQLQQNLVHQHSQPIQQQR